MQAGHIGWGVQACAIARNSETGERKSRSRKTKEERRAMVESFIKRHQSLNNGAFPSLNVTHKEVGGSFYTVREIVREIIQENKVLKPGILSSKVLMLESCPEEHEDESFSYGSSISVLNITSDLACSSSGISLTEAVDANDVDHLALKTSNGSFAYPSENLEYDKADAGKLSEKLQDISIVHEQIFSTMTSSVVEDPKDIEIVAQDIPLCLFNSSFSPSIDDSKVDTLNINKNPSEASLSYCENTASYEVENNRPSETQICPDQMDTISIVCTNKEMLSEPKDLESRVASISSTELQIDFLPVEKHGETVEELSFNGEKATKPKPVVTALASRTPENEEASHSRFKDGEEQTALAMGNFRRLSPGKEVESKTEEENPFWTAFKSFVTAVIKFWME